MAHEIKKSFPRLRDTPGWAQLSREKQHRMHEITSRLLQFQAAEGLAILAQCSELVHAKDELDGQPMNFTNYTVSVFRQGARTAWRRLAEFEELSKYWPEHVIKVVAEKGALLLRGAVGSGMRQLINAARVLPAPRSQNPKTIDAYIQQDVRGYLREERQKRRQKNKREPLGENEALKTAFRQVVRIIRATELLTDEQKRDWLTQLVGLVMQDREIPGVVHTGRKPIPDFIPRRGPKPKQKTEGSL